MSYHYYAVRYLSAPDQVRIEKASTPELAFRFAFGVPATTRFDANTEWKDLGTRAEVMRSDARRVAALKDPTGWTRFEARARG